jgi:hypothetical protein
MSDERPWDKFVPRSVIRRQPLTVVFRREKNNTGASSDRLKIELQLMDELRLPPPCGASTYVRKINMQKNLWSRVAAAAAAISISGLTLLSVIPALPGTHVQAMQQGEDIDDSPADNTPPDDQTPVESVYGAPNPNTNISGYSGGGSAAQPEPRPYPQPEGIFRGGYTDRPEPLPYASSPTAGPSSRSYSTNGSDYGVTTGYGTGGLGTTGSTLSVSPNNPTPVTGY